MNKKEKQKIIIFARDAFRKFYAENPVFLSNKSYKPGKRTYRNLSSMNKMMYLFVKANSDYIVKNEIIKEAGWEGPSSYVQHERIITNFDLSDTSWEQKSRPVLLLNEKGISLRKKYADYFKKSQSKYSEKSTVLPQFAKRYIRDEIKNTVSGNMTLWKNTIITALFLYCELGYIHKYKENSVLTDREKRALKKCLNYMQEDGENFKDLTYIEQLIAMLRDIDLIDENNQLTDIGYRLLKSMKIFHEVDSSMDDYEEIFENDIDKVEEILDTQISLQEVDPPKRGKRKRKISIGNGSKNIDFKKADKENKLTGDLGEKLVLEYEKNKLKASKIPDIDEKVFLTSSKKDEYGNAYPCDIISYNPKTGDKVFIEVKTTRKGINTPFYISDAEVKFSEDHENNYVLYRVFDALVNATPKFYRVEGKVEDNFLLENERYIAGRYEK